jgi:hypothetical protein
MIGLVAERRPVPTTPSFRPDRRRPARSNRAALPWPALAGLAALVGLSVTVRADGLPTDEARSAFRLRREVTVRPPADAESSRQAGFAALPLPPEVSSGGSPGLA